MKKILLCGLRYEKNFGDTIIIKCTKSMLINKLEELDIDYKINEIDLFGRCDFNKLYEINSKMKLLKKIIRKICLFLKKAFKKLKFNKLSKIFEDKVWKLSEIYLIYEKYYKEKIKEANYIVFVGGGLIKYKYQNLNQCVDYITKYANKYEKKVYFNAVGVEGFDETNYNCLQLKEAINRDCVKVITTRDDIETLKKYICNTNIKLEKVADSAVSTKNIYNIKKDINGSYIGLGVCRERLFKDNDIDYSVEEMLKLWENVIKELERKKYKWKIYTNGLEADNQFAYKLLKYLGKEKNAENCIIPKNDKELIEIISKFKGIIATRLHSCIVSYSLDVPAIGLVWNKKLKMFGENIKYPERFIEIDEFNAENIVSKLEEALKNGYTNTDIKFKDSVITSINKIVEEMIDI